MVTIGILGPDSGQKTLERKKQELKGWPWGVLEVHFWGETGCQSQRRVRDSRHSQAHRAFEEATGGLTDIIPGSEIIII